MEMKIQGLCCICIMNKSIKLSIICGLPNWVLSPPFSCKKHPLCCGHGRSLRRHQSYLLPHFWFSYNPWKSKSTYLWSHSKFPSVINFILCYHPSPPSCSHILNLMSHLYSSFFSKPTQLNILCALYFPSCFPAHIIHSISKQMSIKSKQKTYPNLVFTFYSILYSLMCLNTVHSSLYLKYTMTCKYKSCPVTTD